MDDEGNPTRYEGITEENLDRFTRFMDEYHARVESQSSIGSETAVQAFLLGEKLRIKQSDLIKNMENIDRNFEELEKMSVEDLIGGQNMGNRRFRFSDYERVAEMNGIHFK